jgi:glycosyltransferase involved in cell wall biosynthesis
MTSSPPAMPVLIFDEVFSSMMIHALWLKKHFRARVYIYCFENLPFPPLRNLLAKFFVKYLDGAFCSCREAAQRLHELGLKNLQICPFPVREPAPDKIKTIRTIKTVAYLGRLLKEKGVLELCEAMKSFPALELLIAGRGELEKELSHYKINYLGALSPDTIDDFYARIEVLAVPSQTTPGWKEQYGRVIAEAMARGVIVIGSDSGSIPELIGDPKLIFREKSIDAIIDKIKYLTSLNPEELNSISQALRQRYQDHLSNNAFKNILIKGFGSS